MTGGAGFVGIPVTRRLASLGLDVHVVDNLVRRSGARFEALCGPISTLHEADVRDGDRIAEVVDEVRPDVVVHLAALHFIPYCNANPAETLEVNVLGTQHVLRASARSGVRRLVFASTADVYRPDETPHAETHALDPGGVYGLSKLLGETLVERWAAEPGARTAVVTRLFNVIGPGETNPHLVPEILTQLRTGDVLHLGNTSPRRDYIWVDDVAEAIASFVEEGPPDRDVTTVNVGTGVSTSADEIVEILRRLTGRPLRIQPDERRMRASDRPNLQADVGRLRELRPALSPTRLEDSLARLLEDLADVAVDRAP